MPNRLFRPDFYDRLFNWYDMHHRDLPWRDTKDPYIIWVSEIILQQTRVAQGLDYFKRFVSRFPDIRALAEAQEDEVLRYWQGLGYYSRARNLHETARVICKQHEGIFPSEHGDIRKLKGIGDYTAAAIASFAWDQPYAVLDGNVHRVLSRLFSIPEPIDSAKGKRIFKELAQEILDTRQPGLYNQAIMELGALQCVPANPACPDCPLSGFCSAYLYNKVQDFPVKQKKAKTVDRYLNYFQILSNHHTWIRKRTGKDIWNGLYEFPLIEKNEAAGIETLLTSEELGLWLGDGTAGKAIEKSIRLVIPEIKHVLTHQIIHASFYQIFVEEPGHLSDHFLMIKEEELGNYAFSRLTEKFLERANP